MIISKEKLLCNWEFLDVLKETHGDNFSTQLSKHHSSRREGILPPFVILEKHNLK